VRVGAAVRDDHHARMLREAHADAAAVVQRHPGRAARGVQQRVEQRPVAHGVEPSFIDSVSRFGLATEPVSRWSRPITIGAFSSPFRPSR
jgi:hypothetical protein